MNRWELNSDEEKYLKGIELSYNYDRRRSKMTVIFEENSAMHVTSIVLLLCTSIEAILLLSALNYYIVKPIRPFHLLFAPLRQ